MTTTFDESFYRQSSSDRYQQIIGHIQKDLSIWTLSDAEGCLIIELGSTKVLPVWPSSELAAEWAKKDYEGFSALEINANDWQEKWLLGMQNDGYSVGVSPNLAGECIVSSAEEHALDIKA